jgi:uncharacterized glyoxalase superfamily protein PhnB
MTTATLQARSLEPALTVNDLKRSIHFYTEGLGFTIAQQAEEGEEMRFAMLEAGGAHLGLSQDDFAQGRNRVKGVGLRLYFETEQDLKVLARQAKAAGITLDQGPGPLPWGPMGFTVTDPDGFKLTIANPS